MQTCHWWGVPRGPGDALIQLGGERCPAKNYERRGHGANDMLLGLGPVMSCKNHGKIIVISCNIQLLHQNNFLSPEMPLLSRLSWLNAAAASGFSCRIHLWQCPWFKSKEHIDQNFNIAPTRIENGWLLNGLSDFPRRPPGVVNFPACRV